MRYHSIGARHISRLPKGLKVEFSKPVDVGESYDSWMKKQLRDVAKEWELHMNK